MFGAAVDALVPVWPSSSRPNWPGATFRGGTIQSRPCRSGGISTGDVSFEDADVFGAPVVEASRLCAAAQPGQVLAADLVRSLARGRGGHNFEPVGDLMWDDRARAEAERRGLPVECHHADANALDAFEPGTFDLVSAQYASIPRTPDDRGVHNLMKAVAPGGTLLVVSHDLEPMRRPVDTTNDSQAFDPDAYVRVEDFAAAPTASPDWTIEAHEKRPRPPGAASAAHHVDDIVLRARRTRNWRSSPRR